MALTTKDDARKGNTDELSR
ncbi:hypothetical protein CCACVL1_04925 [Corchorus capsularis]|uniref:Uncharacterized protein n=1 Tax=Corchorus capsularis TaxID=210143 RepID=A0A1R3JNT4_COCAP|nr:hypothetical protein CCACVL1_04925 [Corchorus capsularis]